ncbi:hypothetical protein E4U23_001306 [Claviceps purpurea]|nr:hypothetical protein E4U23_001306 [Claviceps purpurea]
MALRRRTRQGATETVLCRRTQTRGAEDAVWRTRLDTLRVMFGSVACGSQSLKVGFAHWGSIMSATGSVIGFVTGARLQQLPQHNHQTTTTTTTPPPPPPDDCGQTTIATCLQPACMQHVTGALAATGRLVEKIKIKTAHTYARARTHAHVLQSSLAVSGITGGSRRWAHASCNQRTRPTSESDARPHLTFSPPTKSSQALKLLFQTLNPGVAFVFS